MCRRLSLPTRRSRRGCSPKRTNGSRCGSRSIPARNALCRRSVFRGRNQQACRRPVSSHGQGRAPCRDDGPDNDLAAVPRDCPQGPRSSFYLLPRSCMFVSAESILRRRSRGRDQTGIAQGLAWRPSVVCGDGVADKSRGLGKSEGHCPDTFGCVLEDAESE